MKSKYLLMAVAGLTALVVAEITKNDYVNSLAYMFMIWAILGDILNGVQWHKVTNINTKNAYVVKDDVDSTK